MFHPHHLGRRDRSEIPHEQGQHAEDKSAQHSISHSTPSLSTPVFEPFFPRDDGELSAV
jgi:hypothetical protein